MSALVVWIYSQLLIVMAITIGSACTASILIPSSLYLMLYIAHSRRGAKSYPSKLEYEFNLTND